MPDAVVYVGMLLCCSVAAVGGARLLGSRMWLGGIIASQGRDDWPHGIQEPDVPAFAVAHADALRRIPPDDEDLIADIEGASPEPEIVDLHVRSYTRPSNADRP
jgi:hypothetical protein